MAGFDNDVVYANNADFSTAGAGGGSALNGLQTDGQLWVGSTIVNAGNTNINVGTITSPGGTINIGYSSPDITIDLSGSAAGQTITGNSGGPISPVTGNWNLLTANTTATFIGTAGTQTLDFSLSNLIIGTDGSSITTGDFNVGIGFNVFHHFATSPGLSTGSQNSALGYDALANLQTGGNNCAFGTGAVDSLISGDQNTAIGSFALSSITTGEINIAVGVDAGLLYTTSESSNIIIGHPGEVGESNTIRIGRTGVLPGRQNRTFMAGVSGVTVSASEPVAIDTNGQLSSLGFGANGQVLTSNGPGVSPSWSPAMLINRSGTIDCTVNALNPLFTTDSSVFVPVGLTFAYLNFVGSPTDSFQVSIGWTAPTYNDVTNNSAISGSGFTAPRVGFFISGQSGASKGFLIPAATTVYANVTNVSGTATTFDMSFDIVGYEL